MEPSTKSTYWTEELLLSNLAAQDKSTVYKSNSSLSRHNDYEKMEDEDSNSKHIL